MFKPITIKDIAQALNLSPSTISRALSDSYEINEETKKKVLEYAEQHNYKRNPIALSLKQRRSYSIGVVVCEVANSFFSQAIDGIESVAYAKGYHVIIAQSHDSYHREVVNMEHLANRSVDGLIISMSAETTDYSHIKKLHTDGLPIVFFDRVIDDIDTHKVTANNKAGAIDATRLLYDKGCRRIAHLANAPHLSITLERMEGYRNALEELGLPFNDAYVRYCHHGGRLQEEVDDAIRYFLELPDKPDAIFVASDRLSIGCLSALNRYAPEHEQPVVTGFSNSEVLDLLKPNFSYVTQPAFDIGRTAMEKLIQLIESKYPVEEFEHVVLDTVLKKK